MICQNCHCWVPGKSSFCPCCGEPAGTQNSAISFFWLLGVVITLVIAACLFFVLYLAHVASARGSWALERLEHSGEAGGIGSKRGSNRLLSLSRYV